MRVSTLVFFCAIAASLLVNASDDLIVIEQDYNIVEHAKEGFNAKDIRQVLYVTADKVAIDEYGDNSKNPTETFLIDLKEQRIVDFDHTAKQILVNEPFSARRQQILLRKKQVQSDVDALAPGAVKTRVLKMFGPMLDGNRQFKLTEEPDTKEVAGVKCKTAKIVDESDPAYPPFVAVLHPDMEMPYDNSEVLFLLKIIGEKMAQFLKDNKAALGHVPMELHLELAEGGKLDTKVVSVKKMKIGEFDVKTRPLGDPFEYPKGYALIRKLPPKAVEPVTEKNKNKPD